MTESWTTHLAEFRREHDGERIGYLGPLGELWTPLNLLGIPLGEASERAAAEHLLLEHAMPSIIEPYWCRIPRPLTSQITDARAVDESEWWDQVLVVEISEATARLKPKNLMESEQSAIITVSLPAADILLRDQPDD